MDADEKDWKHIILTLIKEHDDGTNNYNEFRHKSILELDAAGLYRYIDGPQYDPPTIPELCQSQQVPGVDATGTAVTIMVSGNEPEVHAAQEMAKAWIDSDKKALAIIVKAAPSAKLYLVQDCHTSHDAWNALKLEYEPANTFTAIRIKQQILRNQCCSGDDPVAWLRVMSQLYAKLCDTNYHLMSDSDFANISSH